MLSCWNEDVTKRPSFKDLQTNLDRLLAAESNSTYIDFSINPDNLCYQVADEIVPSPNGLLHTGPRSSKRISRVSSRPPSIASGKISPSSSVNHPQGMSASQRGGPPPRRFARTPSPTLQKPHAADSLGGGGDQRETRRPRSMMILKGNAEAAPSSEDDRYV